MIERNTWIRIIRDFKDFSLPELVERKLSVEIDIPINRIISIIGPRRAGKTYYMFQLIKKLLSKNIEKEKILYINFESELLIGTTPADLRNAIDIFYEIYPDNKNKKVYLFFDEIQNVPEWEKSVRTLMDTENVQIFVSGSSSKLLSKEIASGLRGRSLPFYIYPFNFYEFLSAKGFEYRKYLSSIEKAKLMNLMNEYIDFGGYPEVVLYPKEREKILKEILEVTVYRDIIERFKVKNIKLTKLLLKQLIFSTYFSVHSFFNYLKSLGIKVSKNTLYNYSEYFVDGFIVILLKKFSKSYKEMEQTKPKVYFIDNGLMTIGGVDSKGRLMENVVLTEMVKNGFFPNENVFYYQKNGNEVDFLLAKGTKIKKLIQVCYDIQNIETRKREVRNVVYAAKDLGLKEGSIITIDTEGEEKVDGIKVRFIPLLKWFLTHEEIS